MQPVPVHPSRGPASESAADAFGQDTSYHPRDQGKRSTSPARYGEAGGQTTASNAVGGFEERLEETTGNDTRDQRPRGVGLVETYR